MRTTSRLIPAAILAGALLFGSACSSSSGGSKASFCTQYKQAQKNTANLKSTDLASLKKTFTVTESELDKLVGAAPSEIKSDVTKVRDSSKQLNDEVQRAKTEADAQKAITDFSAAQDKKLKPISDKLDAYTKKNCGISSSDSATASS